MKIETDLKRIEILAKERDGENWEFRSFLKQHDMGPDQIDALVHQITTDVSSQIDCTACGNCCKQIKPILDDDDLSQFASGLNMATSDLEKNYLLIPVEDSATYEFKALPCPFLSEKRCSNYDYRPKDCRSYPHLHKDGFTSRLMGVINNYSICPIVFNVYEQLKIELWDFAQIDDIWS